MEKAGHEEILAIHFAKFIRENYRVVKGGKYRHRGDFYNNSHLVNEKQLFDIFTKYKNP